MTALLFYNGYYLYEWGRGYKSQIDDEWVLFNTAAEWKKEIDKITKKNEERQKRHYRRQR